MWVRLSHLTKIFLFLSLWLCETFFETFLGVRKNCRLLMQSCRFVVFSPDLFLKISILSKTVHSSFMKFCSHSTPKGAPAYAKASKSYDWNVRNIAKISPKMAKNSPKHPFSIFFSIFSKTVHTIRTKFFTVILHHIMVLYMQFQQIPMAGM